MAGWFDQFYYYGGNTADYEHTNTLYEYNRTQNSWRSLNDNLASQYRPKQMSIYVQDSWQITDKLCLNIGLRLDLTDSKGSYIARGKKNAFKSGEVEWSIMNKVPASDTIYRDTIPLDGSTWYYKACAYNVAGISEWSDSLEVNATSSGMGLVENETGLFRVFPNPVMQRIQFSVLEPGKDQVQVFLHDLNGQLLHQQVFSTYEQETQTFILDRDIPSGIYILKFIMDGKTESHRIVAIY